MQIQEAKTYVGKRVRLTWLDRKGEELADTVDIYKVDFVPLYGPCMHTEAGDIRLDRIIACEPAVQRAAA